MTTQVISRRRAVRTRLTLLLIVLLVVAIPTRSSLAGSDESAGINSDGHLLHTAEGSAPDDPLHDLLTTLQSPEIHILSPQESALIDSSSVEVQVEVKNFTLDPDRVGGPNEPGFGHWHLFLDGVYQNFVTGTAGFQATLTHLDAGPHRIRVELARNDHTPLPFPQASDTVSITIAEGRPAIRIVQPDIPDREVPPWGRQVTVVNADILEVAIEVENFILDPEQFDGAPVPGHGHWHLFLDDRLIAQSTNLSEPVTGLRPGYHRIVVTLTNNDHTDLEPPVIDTFELLRPFRSLLPAIRR